MKQFRIRLFGQVQGIGFRSFACFHAQQKKLSGFVQNASDEHVEIVVQGTESACQSFLEIVCKGPAWAHVRRFEIMEEKVFKKMTGFEVRY